LWLKRGGGGGDGRRGEPHGATGGGIDEIRPGGGREKRTWVIETQCPGTPPNPALNLTGAVTAPPPLRFIW